MAGKFARKLAARPVATALGACAAALITALVIALIRALVRALTQALIKALVKALIKALIRVRGLALEELRQSLQLVHGHPRAVGAAAAGRSVARGGRDDKALVGRLLLQLVKDALIRGDDEFGVVHLARGVDDLRGRADPIGEFEHAGGRLRVREYRRARVDLFQIEQRPRLELLMHDAGAVPHEHIGAGFAAHVIAQMTIRRP